MAELDFKKSQKLKYVPRKIICPDCKAPMVDMGLDFKAPPKSDVTAWKILHELAKNGFTFHSCGCYVGFKPPKTLAEVPQWIEERRKKSKGESDLIAIDKKLEAKRRNRKARLY